MSFIQEKREVAGDYEWIEGTRDSYPQTRRELLKNKDWEDGVDCLERSMGSSWWEGLVGFLQVAKGVL